MLICSTTFDLVHSKVQNNDQAYENVTLQIYNDETKTWDTYQGTLNYTHPYKNEPIVNAAELCYIWRKIVNLDQSRQIALLEILEKHPKAIIFYNFDYELELLLMLFP